MATSTQAVISGRSAAVLRGIDLARTGDPVQLLAPPEVRILLRSGIELRRTEIDDAEFVEWRGGKVASPSRTALDLLLGGELATTVADLDAVLRRAGDDRGDGAARRPPARSRHRPGAPCRGTG